MFSCFYVSLCFVVMFSLSLVKLLHLQSNNNTYKTNISIRKQTRTTKAKQKKQKSPSRNLRDIYSRSGRGLDILYFCFSFLMFFFEFVCFCFFMFCLCFRLVLLSFCIYNRTNTYTHIKKQQNN